MSRIFINYRRVDSEGYAGRIYDHLAKHFTKDAIFMDVDTIEAGTDFVDVLETAVKSCDVLVAIIGRQWLTVEDHYGQRRLDNPEDFVRIEVAAALSRNIRVIPVLVHNAPMLQAKSLPENLKSLARRHALNINHVSFASDVNRLIKHLEKALDEANKTRGSLEREKEKSQLISSQIKGTTESTNLQNMSRPVFAPITELKLVTLMNKTIFISYKREDETFARRLHEFLGEQGYKIWMDVFDIPKGIDPENDIVGWDDAIDIGLRSSDLVIGVMTPEAVKSHNVLNEWGWALSNNLPLVLIRLKEIEQRDIPHRFGRINYIDFVNSESDGLKILKDILSNPRKHDYQENLDDKKIKILNSLIALDPYEKGVSIHELVKKTGIHSNILPGILDELIEIKCVVRNDIQMGPRIHSKYKITRNGKRASQSH